MNYTKTPIHFLEEELILLATVMFRNLIDGTQNAVGHLALEGEMLQNYENHCDSKLLDNCIELLECKPVNNVEYNAHRINQSCFN